MTKAQPGFRGIAWGRPDQAELMRQVGLTAGVAWVGAGCADIGRGSAVASDLGVDPIDDLRVALGSADDLDLVFLGDPGGFGMGEEDRAAMVAARSRGVRIATLEPVPTSALDMSDPGWTELRAGVRAIDAIRFGPLTRWSESFAVASEVRESFGRVRSLSIELLGRSEHGSLGARLFDAIELVVWLVGEPELVDACSLGPRSSSGLHALPGETLSALHGDLGALIRYADGRVATLMASDQAGAWERSATLLGENGRLRITESGFVWTGADGELIDTHQVVGDDSIDPGVRAISQSLQRLLDPDRPPPAPIDHGSILSIAQTALLSARTGQGESPRTIQHLVNRV